jgi:hypothetical protein
MNSLAYFKLKWQYNHWLIDMGGNLIDSILNLFIYSINLITASIHYVITGLNLSYF